VVAFIPSYSQVEAPSIYGQATLYVHAQYNDVCPSTVIEAMACGLPIVYSASGGTPELVGPEAGIGVPAPLNWDVIEIPSAEAFAKAILTAAECWEKLSQAARQRAVERFDIRPWIQRHREVFHQLLGLS